MSSCVFELLSSLLRTIRLLLARKYTFECIPTDGEFIYLLRSISFQMRQQRRYTAA